MNLDLLLHYSICLALIVFGSIALFILLHNIFQHLETRKFLRKNKNYAKILLDENTTRIDKINNARPVFIRNKKEKGIYSASGEHHIVCTCLDKNSSDDAKTIKVHVKPNRSYKLAYDDETKNYSFDELDEQ